MSQNGAEVWQVQLNKFNHIANKAIESYSFLTASTIQLLNYSENATYLVKKPMPEKKYILRVCRPNYHTKAEIESEIAWLKSIHENSPLQVSLPVLGDNGEYIQKVSILDDPRDYYCSLFTFLEGDTPDETKESELIFQFENLGEITAQLHEHSMKNHKTFSAMNRLIWDYEAILGENPKWARWQDGLAITPEREQLFQKVSETIKRRLDRFGKDPTRFGLIHADLRLANLLVDGTDIKVIDFDDCGFGWYLFDLATSLSFIEHKDYVPALIKAWLKGYRKIRHLTTEEEQEIPTFIMMRRLMLISWIGSRENETAQQLGSEYTVQTDALAKEYLYSFE